MADIFYFSCEDKEAADEKRMFQIPLKDCIHLFDIRPRQRKCGLDGFPGLMTGDPLVDSGGYIHVVMRISAEEIEKSGEGGYEPGWYMMNKTVIEVQSLISEASKKARQEQGGGQAPQKKP